MITGDQVREVSFVACGNDCKRMLAIGAQFLKIYTITPNKRELKSTFSLVCTLDLCSHAWLNAKECVCCDSEGSLFVIDFKSNEIKSIRRTQKNAKVDDP